MKNTPQLIKDIGEQGLLQKVQSFCSKEVVGDDGAVIPTHPDKDLVITTDVLVDGVHFSDRTTTAFDVGWRAAAANLSDLAAMGAEPLAITVGLSLPGNIPVIWVEKLYQGLVNCLQNYNTPIVGGDVCRSSVITVSITALGQVLPHQVIRRSQARVGDAIVVTGCHGLSRAGLELLLHPELCQKLDDSEQTLLIQAHRQPQPRLDVLPHLWELNLKQPIAGMDSSDGLADAIAQICRSSGVGAQIELNNLSSLPLLSKLVATEQAWEWIIYGGEDFELVLCLPLETAKSLVQRLNNGAAIVGKIIAKPQIILQDNQNNYPLQTLILSKGFQHF